MNEFKYKKLEMGKILSKKYFFLKKNLKEKVYLFGGGGCFFNKIFTDL
jgi:hypothetical protein